MTWHPVPPSQSMEGWDAETEAVPCGRIKQLLTMHFGAGASARSIAQELGVAPSTVREYLGRLRGGRGSSGLLRRMSPTTAWWPQLFVNAGVGRVGARFHAEPDWSALVRELKRPGVNPAGALGEYRAVHPEGLRVQPFFANCSASSSGVCPPTMRQSHAAGA